MKKTINILFCLCFATYSYANTYENKIEFSGNKIESKIKLTTNKERLNNNIEIKKRRIWNTKSILVPTPAKPTLTVTPTITNLNSIEVEVNGEIGTKVFVNGIDSSKTILFSRKVNIILDISGKDGDKVFSIVLENRLGKKSETLIVTIEKDTIKPIIHIDNLGRQYDEPIGVTLTVNYDEIIHYTIDGSVPSKNNENTISIAQRASIFIKESITLQCYATDKANNRSDTKVEQYILPDIYKPTVKLLTPVNNAILYNTKPIIKLELKDTSGIDYRTLKVLIDNEDVTNLIIIENDTISYIPEEEFDNKKINIYIAVKDTVGNSIEKYYSFTVDSSQLVIKNSHKSGYYNKPFYFKLSSNRESKIYYTIDGSTPRKNSRNTKEVDSPLEDLHITDTTQVKYFGTDEYDHQTDIETVDLNFDNELPIVTFSSIINDDYINTLKPTIIINYEDKLSGINISKINFKINGLSKTNSADIGTKTLSYTPIFDLNEDINTIELLLVDNVGNSKSYLYNFRIDVTNPISTISHKKGKYNHDILVSISSNEIGYIYYTLDSSEPIINETNKLQLPIEIEINESLTLKYIIKDLANNLEQVKEYSYVIDKTLPSPPKNLVTKTEDNKIKLNWDIVDSNNTIGYNIYRKIGQEEYTKINDNLNKENHYADITNSALPIYYKTTAVNSNNQESSYSNEVTTLLDTIAPEIILAIDDKIITNNNIFNIEGMINDLSSMRYVKINTTLVSSKDNYKNWTFSQDLIEGDNLLKIEAVDEYNNISIKEIIVQLDTVIATTTSSIQSGIYNTIQNVILTSNENDVNIYYTIDNSIPTLENGILYKEEIQNITENVMIKYISIDKANNIEDVNILDLKFAFKDIAISSSLEKESVFIDLKPTIKFTYLVHDNSLVDEKTKITLDLNDITVDVRKDNNTFTFVPKLDLKDDKHTISIYLEDKAGNTMQKNYIFTIDRLKPKTSIAYDGNHFFKEQKNIELSSNKEATIYFTLNNNEPIPNTDYTYSGINTAKTTIDDTTTIKYFSIDSFGRKEEIKTKQFIVDKTTPTIILRKPNDTQITNDSNLEVQLNINDEAGIDFSKSIFKVDNIDKSNIVTSLDINYSQTWEDGLHSIYINIFDINGNQKEAIYSFTIDTIAPQKPKLLNEIPKTTRDNNISVEIEGEINTEVFVNGISTNMYILESGKLIFDMDISGDIGDRAFNVTLQDIAGNISENLVLNIEKLPSLPVFTNNSEMLFNTVGKEGFSKGSVSNLSIAINSNNIPYAAYIDRANSNKLTVKKFDGDSWVTVGREGFSKSDAHKSSISIDNNNIPYVTYVDSENRTEVIIKKFNGNSWVKVGSRFSRSSIYSLSMAINNNNIPYIAFEDYGNNWEAAVKKFNGTSWVNVGREGFTYDDAEYIVIAINNNNVPYVAYQDYYNSHKATVKKFNGTSWVTVGREGFSRNRVLKTSIAIDNNDIPYIVYKDGNNIIVKKFNGNSWVTVGMEGFAKSSESKISIAIDNSNIPYISYKDYYNSNKATVKKFDGESWVTVGIKGFSKGTVNYTSIAIDNKDIPYVTYKDYENTSKVTVKKLTLNIKNSILENQLNAIDINAVDINNDTLTYSILNSQDSSLVTIDGDTGIVTFKDTPDYETKKLYEFKIKVINSQGGSAVAFVSILILDEEEIILNKISDKTISENHNLTIQLSSKTNLIGTITYEAISLDEDKIKINIIDNELIITPLKNDNFTSKIEVTSYLNGFSDTKIFNVTKKYVPINIIDPISNIEKTIKENKLEVIDIDAKDYLNTKLIYTLKDSYDSEHFTINSDTGTIRFKAIPDYENPIDLNKDNIYDAELVITNEAGQTISEMVHITIEDEYEDSSLPSKPALITSLFYSNSNIKNIDVYGEIGTEVLVNNINTNTIISQSGIANIAINTSGEDGEKSFSISTKRSDGTISSSVQFKIIKDSIKPLAPTVLEVSDYTNKEKVHIKVNGQIGSEVFINNISTSRIIEGDGTVLISLNTIGNDGERSFDIMLKDKALNQSDTVNIKIIKDAISPLKPEIVDAVATRTREDSIEIELSGEVGTSIIVNAVPTNVLIKENGKATITLDTSGAVGTRIFNIVLKDLATNISEVLTLNIKKDLPQSIISHISGAYNENIIVNIKSEDTATIYYTTDGTVPTKEDSQSAISSVDILVSSDKVIKYFSINSSGDVERLKTNEYIIDKVSPIIISPIDDIYTKNNKEKLIISFSDEKSGININKSIFKINNQGVRDVVVTNSSIEYEPTWSEREHNIYLKLYDNAGNFIEKSFNFIVDNTAPNTIITPDEGSYNNLTISLKSDTDAIIYYTLDGQTPTKENSMNALGNISIDINNTTTVKYFAIDKLENIEKVKSKEFIIDNQKPELVSGVNGDLQYISQKNMNEIFYTFVDNGNIKSIKVLTKDGRVYENFTLIGTNSVSIKFDPKKHGKYSFIIEVIDEAGNITLVPVEFSVDFKVPNTIASIKSGKYSKDIKVDLISNEKSIIYYSTDGYPPIINEPNTKSGTSPIVGIDINKTTSLQFFAVDTVGNKEQLRGEVYRFEEFEKLEFKLTAIYNQDENNVKLAWDNIVDSKEYKIFKVNNIVESNILQHTKDNNYLAQKNYLISNSKTNSYIDTNIQKGSKYYYAVSRINSQGIQSIVSNIVSVNILAQDIAIDASEGILRAKNYLFATQNKKGYWSKDNKLSLLLTAEVLNSLYEFKDENPAAFNLSTSYLYSTYASNNDFLSRKIIALGSYGFNVDSLINKLISQSYLSSSYIYGWGINKEYKVSVLDTILGIKATNKATKSLSKYNGGKYTLKQLKNSDGYWGWTDKGKTSIYISSLVYNTINAQQTEYQWIIDSQNEDGSFGDSLMDTLGVVLNLNLEEDSLVKATKYILAQQNINGHWEDDPYITALCLQALKKGNK